jgi:hypothetical protein
MEIVPARVVVLREERGGGRWIRKLEYEKNSKTSSVAKCITVRHDRRPIGVDRR